MVKMLTLLSMILITSCASSSKNLDGKFYYPQDLILPINFVENPSHLALNVNYGPVEKIRQDLEQRLGYELKNRGEAHITVISPIEYIILKNKLSMLQINDLVRSTIQKSSFKPLCLGRGRMQIDGKEEETYYLVTESQDLTYLRSKIKDSYVAAGGSSADFKDEIYFPHITLGFIKRDLHFEDGVIKDKNSCIADVAPMELP